MSRVSSKRGGKTPLPGTFQSHIAVTAEFSGKRSLWTPHNSAVIVCAVSTEDPAREMWVAVGARLKAARKHLGISAREAARRAKLSDAQYLAMEAGYRTVRAGQTLTVNPKDETLIAAAQAVRLDPAVLFAIIGRPYQPDPEPIQVAASGAVMEELRQEDPDTYATLEAAARAALDRARARRKGPP